MSNQSRKIHTAQNSHTRKLLYTELFIFFLIGVFIYSDSKRGIVRIPWASCSLAPYSRNPNNTPLTKMWTRFLYGVPTKLPLSARILKVRCGLTKLFLVGPRTLERGLIVGMPTALFPTGVPNCYLHFITIHISCICWLFIRWIY